MKRVILIRALVDTGEKNAAEIDSALRQSSQGLKSNLKVFGMKVLGSEFGYADPTREEAIRLTPRRTHIGGDGFTLCGKENVAKSRLTQDWTKVDCKACKKKRQQAGEKQKELFG